MVLQRIKQFLQPKDVYSSLFPIFMVSFLTGLSPFKIIGESGAQVLKLSKLGVLTTIIYLTTFVGCFIKVFIERESMVSFFFKSEISRFGDAVQLTLGCITMCLLYTCSFFNRKKVVDAFSIISVVDMELIKIGMPLDKIYRKTQRLCLFLVVFTLTMYAIYMICSNMFLHIYGIYPDVTSWVAFLLPNLMISFVLGQFLCPLHVLRDRLKCVNKLLNELMEYNKEPLFASNKHSGKVYSVTSSGNIGLQQRNSKCFGIMDTISKLHFAICDSAELIDSYFTIQLLSICSVSFLLIVFNVYYTLLSVNNPVKDPWRYFGILVFFGSQTGTYFLQIVVIVNMCTNLYNEANHSDVLVLKLLNESKDQEMKIRLSQISMQITHRKPRFTAWGLFVLERPLIQAVVGAASTYLIILFQFSSPVKCIMNPMNSTEST